MVEQRTGWNAKFWEPNVLAAIKLMKRIGGMRFPWNLWVTLLGTVNLGGGIYYWSRIEGKTAIAAMTGAFVIMTVIYRQRGFVRLLGLGHIVAWVPLLALLAISLSDTDSTGAFRAWLWTVIGFNGVSLVIDVADVVRYMRGERGAV